MPKKLDPEIATILKDHGFGPDACWDCHGTWVVYHRVLEQIAAKASIRFEPPMVLEANGGAKVAAICVTGILGDKAEWSIGEAAPGNNKTAYPFAMAEKRAKDRVILKLIGLHGLAYSEEEADDFKPAESPPASEVVRQQLRESVEQERAREPPYATRVRDALAVIGQKADHAALNALVESRGFVKAYTDLPEAARRQIDAGVMARRKALGEPASQPELVT